MENGTPPFALPKPAICVSPPASPPCRSASILKFRAPAGLTVPAPVITPRAGIARLILSALVPSGATRAFKLKFWIDVSGFEAVFPVNVDSAPNFDPRSNPASLVFARRTGPVMTNLSMGPTIARFVDNVPPFNCEPEGSTTPSDGNMACSSSTGMLGASSFMLSTWVSACV